MKNVKKITRMELLRRGRGYSLESLSRKLGVSPGLVAQIEGRHRKAYPKIRESLSIALGVEECELFDRESFAKIARGRFHAGRSKNVGH
ncbi:MAG: helix-turn-helix transcriptional regulator [Actinomycetota bacterium]